MSDPPEGLLQSIAAALEPGGWRHRVSHQGIEFVKVEPVKGGEFELVLRFDRKRLHWPPVSLVKIVKGQPDDFPWHRLGENILCHFDSATAEWDPESPLFAHHVVFVAQHFVQEFHRLQKGEALTEADLEFAVHWQGHCSYLDIPQAEWLPVQGSRLERLEFKAAETGREVWIYRLAETDSGRYDAFQGRKPTALIPVVYVELQKSPRTIEGDWPPDNLAALNRFLHQHSPTAGKALWRDFADAMTQSSCARASALIVMRTEVGFFGALVDAGKGGLKGFRRNVLPQMLSQNNQLTRCIKVSRYTFYRVDEDSILGRNQPGDRIPLVGLNIHLIGLGAVGSILADRLVQAGAGSSGSSLHLFDFDVLRPENLGRHLLGVPYLGMGKAEGVSLFLRRNRLVSNVIPHQVIWRDAEIHLGADLVIDATAVPSVGAALSNDARKSRTYAVLWAFVEGKGWVAGAFLYRGRAGEACRTCAEPWLGGAGSNVESANAPVGRSNGCGGVYMPFRAAAADIAAALASELACDWANGLSGKTYRTMRLAGAPSYVHRSRNETRRSKAGCVCSLQPGS